MSPGPRPTPPVDALRFELRALTWERIQVTLRLHPVGSELPADVRPSLRSGESPGSVAAPMRTWREDGDLLVRFNVMHGPGQMPLADGRWAVVLASSRRGAPVDLCLLDGTVLPAAPGVRFLLAEGDYTVDPILVDGVRLAFDVALRPAGATDVGRAGDGDEDGGSVRPIATGGVVRQLRVGSFRIANRVLRVAARRNGRRILFSSDSRSGLGGNLAVVHDRMVERGLDREYELLTMFRPSINVRRSFRDRLRLPWLLARADVILLDDFQPVIYAVEDRRVRIVQLWHASGAFKTVGYSRVGKPGGPSPWSRGHKNYTAAIVSSAHDVPFYAEAFGVREERVVPTGIPRMDRFFDPSQCDAARARAFEAFPMARDRFTILFAPTFRGATREATYDLTRIDLEALHAVAAEKDAVVIFKLHPFVRESLSIPEALADRLIDATRSQLDVNDLLFAVDLLVTDYSSIVFEFSVFRRPMLFYAWDLETYVAERDFYIPFESFVPGRIVRTHDELVDAIRRDDYEANRVEAFAARHFAHLDAGSTDRVIDLALGR